KRRACSSSLTLQARTLKVCSRGQRRTRRSPRVRNEEWLLNAAMHSFRRQVRRLIGKPEPFPLVFDLAKIFRLVQKLVHSAIRIARIRVDETTGIARQEPGHRCQQEQ